MAKKRKNVSSASKEHKEHVEQKNSVKSFIPKDQNAIMTMAIFLIIGLIVGALVTYGAFSSAPVNEQNNDLNNDSNNIIGLSESELSLKVQDYLNNYLVVDDTVNATILSISEIETGLYQLDFEVKENGTLVGNGFVYSTDNTLFLGQMFNLNEPLEMPVPVEEPVEETPETIETKEFSEEEIQQIISFSNCVAEKGIVVYGANWCGYTNNLVDNLGGFGLIEPFYVECTEETELCSQEQITGYPTVKLNGEKINPERTFEGFAEVTGCTAPTFDEVVETQAYSGDC